MKRYILFSVLLMIVASVSFAQPTKADLEKQRASIQKEIDEVKASLNTTKKNRRETLGQLSLIQKKLRQRQALINNINQQMNLIQGDITQSTRDILKLRKELDTLKLQYEKSVVYAYKNRSNYDFLNFLFSSTSFNDALKRVAYLRSYRQYREQQAENIEKTQVNLKGKIAALNSSRNRKKEVLVEENKQRGVLEEEKQEKSVVISNLKSREKELNSELAAKKKQNQKLNASIAAAIRRAREEATREAIAAAKKKQSEEAAVAVKNKPAATPRTTATTSGTEPATTAIVSTRPKPAESVFDADPASKALSNDFEKNKGSLPWPIESGTISMHFGNQKVEGTGVTYNNPGITIETTAGKSVKAVFDGEVSSVFSIGAAQAVILKHGKYFTTYSNVESTTVSKGQSVKRGQVIARVAEKYDGQGDLDFLISNERSLNFNPESWLRN
ncbi:MAG: peptidoglycan DD-metalloendopeptidase family protein [Chitinophagaceae bacterium]|nr:peptidoglycan DD-metalloendopeptidase family protein [Chitinophagaceae bacterium]